MGPVITWSCRALASVVLAGAVLVGGAQVAMAVPEEHWRHGHFVRVGVPVYAEPVDGWACYFAVGCRESSDREPDDPPPIWHSTDTRASLDVECYLGRYYKIHEVGGERRDGWALDDDISTDDRLKPCRAGDF
ncbi:hypothetical protein K1T35_48375 (plasmid) [Pseudonocardia sp. DSM 110487]|uniref:hypothetical protein n=1 Tax=Pseudonocardia sp. DSM 110487 TaxID=2865833 RepID=UPI001C6969EC|nr:hypothetical protein [Pseudonocardia sp. DSM 110487]QYN41165.1 hypothetical protein K1T35_48375 [Pseudonocardia sp. DSM 110487]